MYNVSHGFSTRAIHTGQEADPATGATEMPIYATSTYTQAAPGQHKGYEYSRTGNPTRHALEECLVRAQNGRLKRQRPQGRNHFNVHQFRHARHSLHPRQSRP